MNLRENPFVIFMLGWKAYLVIIVLAILGLSGSAGVIPMADALSLSIIGSVMVLMLGRIIIRLIVYRSSE
ncbi:MAG: hypothetical protein J0L62_02545 [Bacteroidetes bacterium]|nr:hypothetical protein [Bacteroidota bacterium]